MEIKILNSEDEVTRYQEAVKAVEKKVMEKELLTLTLTIPLI